jgi:hypothetical protein
MKNKIFSLFLMLSLSTWISMQKASAQVSVSFKIFYDELSPHGYWVDYPTYGYVWVPNVGDGFTPYATNGYWVFTDEGWAWVSNYSWGWAPFHYGRWYVDPTYGYMWMPDDLWGPGWVTWRMSEGYYGWAPIGPGVGYDVTYNNWRFVKSGYFGRTDIDNYYVSTKNNVTIINNTTVINKGPDKAQVEKHLGKTITPIVIKEIRKPGQSLSNGQLEIYKPKLQNNLSGPKPAPTKLTDLKEIKTSGQKPSETPINKIKQPNKQKPSQPKQTNPPKGLKEASRLSKINRHRTRVEKRNSNSLLLNNIPVSYRSTNQNPNKIIHQKIQEAINIRINSFTIGQARLSQHKQI